MNTTSPPQIFVGITDHLDPEVRAMVMAKYSRDVGTIFDRLPNSKESNQDHKQKLGNFYVGYGHKSVGQLGITDIFFEGVSLLAAKAIENNPLFNGQESSTRYIDFTNQPMISSHPEITVWQEKWRSFYLKALPIIIDKVKKEYPFESQPEGTDNKKWENTVKARAFDICRGFLPAGVTTNVGMSATFDVFNDHFGEMLFHPCQEMKTIAENTINLLGKKYPYAAIDIEKQKERNSYLTDLYFYQTINSGPEGNIAGIEPIESDLPDFVNRNKYQKIPKFLSNRNIAYLYGLLDFGSYRDIHRHRPGCMNMPVLGTLSSFNDFYIQNLTKELLEEFSILFNDFQDWNSKVDYISIYEKQYAVPIGVNVRVRYTCDFNQMMYLFELRSSKTVHQSLRNLIHDWVDDIKQTYGFEHFDTHIDMDEDNFTLKRGSQTFET